MIVRSQTSNIAGVFFCLIALGVSWPVSKVLASPITADIVTGRVGPVGPVVPGATFDVCAFSQRLAPAPTPANVFSTRTLNGVGATPSPTCGAPTTISVGGFLGLFPRVYGPPIVGDRGFPKRPAAPSADSVTSRSGGFVGFAEHDDRAAAAGIFLQATGFGPGPPANGKAAGEAIDPFVLLPDIYDYEFSINQIVLATDDERDFAGVSYFATDSRFNDPLWVLEVGVEGLLASPADLIIGFASNAILNLDNGLIENQVRNAFAVTSGMAELTSFPLFDTTYPVDQTIVGSVGVNAGVERIPEPTTLALLGLGLAGIAFRKKGRQV